MPLTKLKNLLSAGITHFSKCMAPVIPLLLVGGLTKLIVLILTASGVLSDTGSTVAILQVIGNAPFYFLPLFVAYSSAIHFDIEPIYAMAVLCVTLLPDFIAMMDSAEAVAFIGIPVMKASYASTVIPSVVLIYFMSVLVRVLKRFAPPFFIPLLAVLITSLLGILLVGPFCVVLSNLLADGINRLYDVSPAIACAVLSMLMPLMVTTGVHMIFISTAIMQISLYGSEPFIMAVCLNMIMSLGASMTAVTLKTKDPETKKTAFAAGIAALSAGLSEPSLYGICLPKRTPMIACVLACGIAGLYQGFAAVSSYVFAFPCPVSILMFSSNTDPGNLIQAAVSGLIAFCSAFVITMLMYRETGH